MLCSSTSHVKTGIDFDVAGFTTSLRVCAVPAVHNVFTDPELERLSLAQHNHLRPIEGGGYISSHYGDRVQDFGSLDVRLFGVLVTGCV